LGLSSLKVHLSDVTGRRLAGFEERVLCSKGTQERFTVARGHWDRHCLQVTQGGPTLYLGTRFGHPPLAFGQPKVTLSATTLQGFKPSGVFI
jgi:hypothetical protein